MGYDLFIARQTCHQLEQLLWFLYPINQFDQSRIDLVLMTLVGKERYNSEISTLTITFEIEIITRKIINNFDMNRSERSLKDERSSRSKLSPRAKSVV